MAKCTKCIGNHTTSEHGKFPVGSGKEQGLSHGQAKAFDAYFGHSKPKTSPKKSEALKKKLAGFRKSLKNENMSYGELAELGSKKYKKHLYKDAGLAEASGMSEEEFRKHQK